MKVSKTNKKEIEFNFDIFHCFPNGICIIENKYTVLFWNNRMAEWTGIPKNKIVGTSLFDHFSHFEEDVYKKNIDGIFTGVSPVVFPSNLYPDIFSSRKDATQSHMFHTTVISLPTADTSGFYALFFVTDMTEMTRQIRSENGTHGRDATHGNMRIFAEEKMFLSKDEILTLLQNSPDFVMSVDENGTIRYVNRPMPGSTMRDVLGKSFYRFTDPQYHKIFGETISKVFQTGKADSLISSGVRPDGTTAWYEIRFGPVLSGNRVTSVMLIVTNITDRKKSEEEIRNSELRYRLLAENVTDFIWTIDGNLEFMYISPSIRYLLDYRADELIEKSWLNIITPDSINSMTQALTDLPDMEKQGKRFGFLTLELDMIKKDKSIVPTETKISFLRNENDEPIGILGISRDVTERKTAQGKLTRVMEELKRSNAELEQFAYVASHDLQEPLRMVSNYLQLLKRRYQDKLDADAEDFIQMALGGSDRMRNMIDELLSYSRVTTKGKPFELTDIMAVMDQIKRNMKVTLEERNARLVYHNLPEVQADKTQMIQLFQNLISNAIKFNSNKKPTVEISAEKQNHEWIFHLADNGIGMDMKFAERIFEIFQRLHTREEYSGTGIGLSICKKIVERHNGRIWVESKLREGSIFHFTIPNRIQTVEKKKHGI